METLRKPFQGVRNIIRFNWHFYALSMTLAIGLWAFPFLKTSIHPNFTLFPAFLILLITWISLMVSTFVYDFSSLYSLRWMDQLLPETPKTIANLNAGFDETSILLANKYPDAELVIMDFYNPEIHTEISIKRARKAYPPYPNTLRITTNKVPIADSSVDIVFAILSAHEIRNDNERINFFIELRRILSPNGKIIVTEHLRDLPNFFAYSMGSLHFHSKSTWYNTFENAGLKVTAKTKTTPFLTNFVLQNV